MMFPIGRGRCEVDEAREIFGSEFVGIAEPIERVEVEIFLIVHIAFPRCYHPFSHSLVGRLRSKTLESYRLFEGFSRDTAFNSYGERSRLFVAVCFIDGRTVSVLPSMVFSPLVALSFCNA